MRKDLNMVKRRLGVALLAVAMSASTTVGAIADDLPGKGVTVKPITQQGLTEELFQTYLVGMGLEELGYKVEEPVVAAMQAAFVAVANGDATYYAAFWDPLHKSFQEKLGGDEKLPLVGTLVTKSIQGYLIDKKTSDEHHIKTIDQLKDPNVAKLFDVDGGGKAGLYGCQTGWGCERIIEHHLDAYALRGTVKSYSRRLRRYHYGCDRAHSCMETDALLHLDTTLAQWRPRSGKGCDLAQCAVHVPAG
jgi:glycine betaine/proline transport system substrate-binding protein